MNRKDLASAYEPIPQALEYRVQHTLAMLDEKPVRRLSMRTTVIVLALVLSLCGAAYAAYESITANWFGWFYGETVKTELESGDHAAMGQSTRVGDLSYTVEEMVYKVEGDLQGLYGVVRVTPAEGAKVVLVPNELSVHDPAGYLLHYGKTAASIPGAAPSYAELAEQNGAALLTPTVYVNSLVVDGTDYSGCFGVAGLPQADGSVLITLEMTDALPRSDSYTLELCLCNTALTQSGTPDRDAAEERYDWTLTVVPEMKEE